MVTIHEMMKESTFKSLEKERIKQIINCHNLIASTGGFFHYFNENYKESNSILGTYIIPIWKNRERLESIAKSNEVFQNQILKILNPILTIKFNGSFDYLEPCLKCNTNKKSLIITNEHYGNICPCKSQKINSSCICVHYPHEYCTDCLFKYIEEVWNFHRDDILSKSTDNYFRCRFFCPICQGELCLLQIIDIIPQNHSIRNSEEIEKEKQTELIYDADSDSIDKLISILNNIKKRKNDENCNDDPDELSEQKRKKNSNEFSSPETPKKKRQCHFCHEWGHFEKSCPLNPKNKKN
jgi:hypothetical protein